MPIIPPGILLVSKTEFDMQQNCMQEYENISNFNILYYYLIHLTSSFYNLQHIKFHHHSMQNFFLARNYLRAKNILKQNLTMLVMLRTLETPKI